jgi:hypothetical protein
VSDRAAQKALRLLVGLRGACHAVRRETNLVAERHVWISGAFGAAERLAQEHVWLSRMFGSLARLAQRYLWRSGTFKLAARLDQRHFWLSGTFGSAECLAQRYVRLRSTSGSAAQALSGRAEHLEQPGTGQRAFAWRQREQERGRQQRRRGRKGESDKSDDGEGEGCGFPEAQPLVARYQRALCAIGWKCAARLLRNDLRPRLALSAPRSARSPLARRRHQRTAAGQRQWQQRLERHPAGRVEALRRAKARPERHREALRPAAASLFSLAAI